MTPPVRPAAELPRVPGYDVQAALGHGGMGVVFKAWHLRLHRPVALKMLLAGACATPAERERCLKEAQAVAGLRHPNIVQVHDVGEHDGRPYFTMEFVEGAAWRRSWQARPSRPARLRRKKYFNVGYLVVDEVGFEPMSRQDASLFFRLVSYRYLRGSTAVTTNKAVKDWPGIFAGDEAMTAAILNRLLHKSVVLNIRGRSYRLEGLEKLLIVRTEATLVSVATDRAGGTPSREFVRVGVA